MIGLAYNANGLRNLTIEDAIKNVAMAGYDGIELSLHKNHMHPFTVTTKDMDRIKGAGKDNSLKFVCLATGCDNLLSDVPFEPSLICSDKNGRAQRIDMLKKSIEIATYLECPVLNFASGFKEKAMTDSDAQKYLEEGIQNILAYCGKLILAIEPEPNMFIGTTDAAIKLINEINSPNLRLNVDIGHVYCCEEDYLIRIEKAMNYTAHCHIEDIKNRIHHHEIPGTGDIDFQSIFKILKASQYDKYISVELYHHTEVWRQALNESFKYLKNYIEDITK